MISACRGNGFDSNVVCDTSGGLTDFTATKEADSCEATVETLAALVVEYSRGTDTINITCTFGGFLADNVDCDATTNVINDMINSFLDGSFEGCEMTTPTTTMTSSSY